MFGIEPPRQALARGSSAGLAGSAVPALVGMAVSLWLILPAGRRRRRSGLAPGLQQNQRLPFLPAGPKDAPQITPSAFSRSSLSWSSPNQSP